MNQTHPSDNFMVVSIWKCVKLEIHKVGKGYCRGVDIGEDETAVAVNSNGMAHALVNVDPVRSTFFIGCQDSSIYAEQLRYSDYKNMERSIILSCLV